ncbi:MAG: sigma-70 family RNA polymerase sigma factor [candidate division Zixibacteria bacterium]
MSSAREMSDGELVGRVSGGDETAFREILRRYRERVLAICLRMLKNRTEAEEAAQDSFVKAYYHLESFDKSRDFSAWLAGIAINECRDRLRKRSRFRKLFREIPENDLGSRQVSQDEDYESKVRIRAIENAIEQLPEKLREVLVLRAYADYSYEEIAGILNIEIGTVMSRLHRSRAKLTEIIKRGTRQ